MDYKEYIASNTDIMLGKPVIEGTRITAALVLQRLSEGATVSDLLIAYPSLTSAAIDAVLVYASDQSSPKAP